MDSAQGRLDRIDHETLPVADNPAADRAAVETGPTSTRRRILVWCAIGGLLPLAGCSTISDNSDDGGPGDDGAKETGGPDDNINDTGGGGDLPDDSGSDGASSWNPLEFARAGTYTYEFYFEDEGEGTVVLSVSDVSDESVTVSIDYRVGETTFETTTTGPHNTIHGQLMASPASPFVFMTLFSPFFGYYHGETLEVGNRWSHMLEDGMATFEITEQRSYGGVECHASEMRVDGDLWHEGCFAVDHGSSIRSVFYDSETGEITASVELVDYQNI